VPHIAFAVHAARVDPRCCKCWKQDRDKQSDNSNNNQKFYERKTCASSYLGNTRPVPRLDLSRQMLAFCRR
jgi:hypothetical protein